MHLSRLEFLTRSGLFIFLVAFTLVSCGETVEPDTKGEWAGNWETFLDSGAVFALEAKDENIVASTNNGLLVSFDQGEYFEQAHLPGLDGATINSIVLRTDRWFVAGNNGKVWESTDMGFTWKHIGALPTATEVRMSASGQDLMAALKTGGVFRSTDYGRTWTSSDSGITANEIGTVFYHSALLIAGPILSPMLFRSTDFGDTWVRTDSGYNATAVLDFAGLGKDVYAAAADKGVYHSGDKALSWESRSSGLPAKMYAQSLLAERNYTYVGGAFSNADQTDPHVLYRSNDQGKTWTVADDGLSNIGEVTTVVGSDNFILVGTRGQGIWRRKRN